MIKSIAKSSLAAIALLGILAFPESASAVELVKLKGKVSVNRGDGFEPAKQGMKLKTGDQILVGKDGVASLIYEKPGCIFEVPAASVVTVKKAAPCAPGQTTSLGKSVFARPAGVTSDGPDLTPFYVMGGGAILGTIAFYLSERKEGDGGGDDGGVGSVSED